MKKSIISVFFILFSYMSYGDNYLSTDSVNSSWNDIYNWKEGRSSVLIELLANEWVIIK